MVLGDLCAYVFIGNYKTYPNSCSFGLVVAQPSNGVSDDGYSVVFHKLGFNSMDEYIKSYPGKFAKDSPQQKALLGGSNDCGSGVYYKKINIELVSSGNSVQIGAGGYSTQFLTTKFPFITPTIKEMSEIIKCENPKSKDLWYCSDWRESDMWLDLQC